MMWPQVKTKLTFSIFQIRKQQFSTGMSWRENDNFGFLHLANGTRILDCKICMQIKSILILAHNLVSTKRLPWHI